MDLKVELQKSHDQLQSIKNEIQAHNTRTQELITIGRRLEGRILLIEEQLAEKEKDNEPK